MKNLLILTILMLLLANNSCEFDPYPNSNYPAGYPSYPNSYPNSYPGYPYPNYPPPNYPPNNYPYPPQYPGGYNNYPRYPGNYYPGHNRPNHDHDRDTNSNNKPNPAPINNPPPQPPPQVIKPSCPSGTVYDGRHCKITDDRLKKPGGDGRINPCPKGMWNSGGTCIKE